MNRIKLLNNNYFNTEDIKHRDIDNQLVNLKEYLNKIFIPKNFSNGSGINGYMKICTLNIFTLHIDTPIKFEIIQRNRRGKIYLQFSNSTEFDAPISYFEKEGNINAYLVKTTSATWDLYIQKSESWDSIYVTDFFILNYGINVLWIKNGESVTTLPNGYVTATSI